ncbi:MAG TPA: tRNA 2-thiouridine(34) synthase MnmA [Gaiellales bacterium]
MYSAATIEHALALRHAGSAGRGAVAGEAGDTACGDAIRIELGVAGGHIGVARHRSFACPHATAAAELACRLAEGRDLLAAARIGSADLEAVLAPAERNRGCVALAVDALHRALATALDSARMPLVADRVAVAMSGGVDSAVALLKAVEAGLEPVGVTLRLWIDPGAPDGERACCSPQSVRAARAACHALGVPHVGLDLRQEFHDEVVEEFVAGFRAGRTPNPCMRCNGSFRFAALADFADRIGARRIATGHYARIRRRGEMTLVARGADPAKDQSYMLAAVPAAILRRCWFPLGEQTKAETRAQAGQAGLEAARRRESQDVCFVGGGDHRAFLERHGGAGRPGDIVAADGRRLGRHAGVHRFTPGQRRGIGVAGNEPLYVVSVEAERGRVVVGPRTALERRSVHVTPGRLLAPSGRVQAKLRYRTDPVWATVRPEPGGFTLDLDEPVAGIAPGQTAVLYDGDAVVGTGVIAG